MAYQRCQSACTAAFARDAHLLHLAVACLTCFSTSAICACFIFCLIGDQAVERCNGDLDAAVKLYERERLPDLHALFNLDITSM